MPNVVDAFTMWRALPFATICECGIRMTGSGTSDERLQRTRHHYDRCIIYQTYIGEPIGLRFRPFYHNTNCMCDRCANGEPPLAVPEEYNPFE